jgi:HAD superfamily hydrolase (TIGR01484 family)
MNTFIDVFNAASLGNLTLMLDLDGATIVRKPGIHDPVQPESDLESDLIRLMNSGCNVIINTGRPEKFVRNLFPIITAPDANYERFWLATETGARIRRPDQTMLFERAVPEIKTLRSEMEKAVAAYSGAFIEDHKICAITVSLAAAENRRAAYSNILAVCNALAATSDSINIIPVYKPDDAYIEIVPAHVNKGTAAKVMLDTASLNTSTIVCFGDSSADTNMMAVTNDCGGYSVGVGSKSPQIAQVRLADHKISQEIIRHLADLASTKSSPQQASDSRLAL